MIVTQNSKGQIYRLGSEFMPEYRYSYWCRNCNYSGIASEAWDFMCARCGMTLLSIPKKRKSKFHNLEVIL